jgi:6-phosphogluconolactonase
VAADRRVSGGGAVMTTVLPDPEAVARAAADWLLESVRAAGDRPSAVCLAGGSTPQRLYELLPAPPYRDAFPWQRVHWFWGDERFVPPEDERSNYRMVRRALLDRAAVPAANIHPIPTTGAPRQAAAAYERELRRFYAADTLDPARPLFDATLLGLGEDGHTASLFPWTAALEERARWVVAVEGVKPEPRITLTYPALESSGAAALLVTGAGKRDIVRRVRAGADLPAARLRPVGRLRWFLDRAAAPDNVR